MTDTTATQWSAPSAEAIAGVPDHSGLPQDAKHELFGDPPKTIGRLLSADSTLKPGKVGLTAGARFALAVAVALIAICILYFWVEHVGRSAQVSVVIFGGMVSLLAVFIAWTSPKLWARASYVGAEGLYDVIVSGTRSSPQIHRTLRFADAAELHVSQTRKLKNGQYHGTHYSFFWNDAAGKLLYDYKGEHHGNDKLPKPGDPFHFALAAEIAWTNFYLAQVERQLQQEGAVSFRVDGKRFLRIGPGFIEFHFGEEPHRVTPADIAKVTLGGGEFSFKHKDAKWFSKEGKYKFSYAGMANAKVFLLACDKFLGYRWS